ncbi:MAG: hypothetical protein WAU39_14865 [Polyangiales bacterium]
MRFDKSLFREAFLTIDIRTLGLARIYIALLLLFDLAKRATEMSTWYFETGLLPNAMLAEATGCASIFGSESFRG